MSTAVLKYHGVASKPIIAFDTFIFAYPHNGTYAYAINLLKEFQELLSDNDGPTIRPFTASGMADQSKLALGRSPNIKPAATAILKYRRLWRLGGASLAALRIGADLLFSPSVHATPVLAVPVVTTIHDVMPAVLPGELVPGRGLLNIFTRVAARFSRRILTDSEFSKNDIVRLYGVPPEKIKVVYLGFDRELFNKKPIEKPLLQRLCDRHGIRSPYLIHHGTVHPRKNLTRLIQAYSLILSRRADFDMPLVLAGPLGWRNEQIRAEAEKVHLPGNVVFTGALTDAELATLVKGAALCVVPSLYEGFCLPVIESMACGTPTIASQASCIPEVSGGCLRYFDPYSVGEIAALIEQVLDDSDLRENLSRKGAVTAAQFSWRQCARETLAELVEAAQENRTLSSAGARSR